MSLPWTSWARKTVLYVHMIENHFQLTGSVIDQRLSKTHTSCLFNSLFKLTTKEKSMTSITGYLGRKSIGGQWIPGTKSWETPSKSLHTYSLLTYQKYICADIVTKPHLSYSSATMNYACPRLSSTRWKYCRLQLQRVKDVWPTPDSIRQNLTQSGKIKLHN